MKTKFNGILTLLLALVVQFTFAQERVISGVVSDDMGPVADISVIVKGTTKGTVTDFDGKYSIKAKTGDVLVFSHVSYGEVEKIVGDTNKVDAVMKETGEQLEEIIITAQGIKRKKKSLGYSIAKLKSDDVENKTEADIGRVLSGKVSGVNVIATGGLAGSGTKITIRGTTSITQSNQPLFVVDGIPFSSDTNRQSFSTGNGGVSTTSRFLDIDPNNIESLNVLKGLSATVLYGNAGRNGVILIETKTGSAKMLNKKFEISIAQSTFVNTISNLPDYQNTYGQGANNQVNVGYIGNWGDLLDTGIMVRHHYNQDVFASSFPQFQGVEVEYKAFKNNVKDFFRNGIGNTTFLSASKSTEKSTINLSVGQTNENGFVPGNNLRRINFGLGGSMTLSNNLTVKATFNFSKTDFTTPPVSAANGAGNFSIFGRLLFIPRNLDLMGLPYQDPVTGASVYYRSDLENPLWLVDNSQESNRVNRFYNSLNALYSFNDTFKLNYRVGLDTYTENQQFYINKGGIEDLAKKGFLRTTSLVKTVWDHNIDLSASNLSIAKNINVNWNIGFNANGVSYKQNGLVSTDQVVFGFINHKNFQNQSNIDPLGSSLNYEGEVNTLGLYSLLVFDYSDYLFLSLSARNDWSSTVETENNSLFYPSASLSFLPTTAFSGLKGDVISLLKIRGSYATSAGFPGPYRTRPVLSALTSQFTDANGNVINTNSNNFFFSNPDLKPELHKETEFGIEANLWKNRIDLETNVYFRDSENQILNKRLDASTGYASTLINAGGIETKGFELNLGLKLLKSKKNGFNWTTNMLFDINENTVRDLPGGNEILMAGFLNIGNYAIEGEPLGVIKGSFAVRDTKGNLMINPTTGNIISSSDIGLDDKIIGNPNPNWKMTNRNTFSFKGFALSSQFEYTHGGDIASTTITKLLRRGVTTDTEDRDGTYIIPGFLADPSNGQPILDSNGNKIPNNIQQGLNEIYFLNYVDTSEQQIFDGSVFRLREVSLSYELPRDLLKNTPIGSISFTLLGQNLWYLAPNVPKGTNFDPEVISTGVGNGLGLDYMTTPTSKKYGFNIKLTF